MSDINFFFFFLQFKASEWSCLCRPWHQSCIVFTVFVHIWRSRSSTVKHLLYSTPTPGIFTLHRLGDLLGLPQKFWISGFRHKTELLAERSSSSSALRVKWLCGCFRSPAPGSLPVTVLWTSSSWGPSTAKDRWQARAEKPPPPPLSTPPPAVFVFLFLSAFLSSISYVTGQNRSAKRTTPSSFLGCAPPFSQICDGALPNYVPRSYFHMTNWNLKYNSPCLSFSVFAHFLLLL